MDKEQIVNLLKSKITENQFEVDGCTAAIDDLRPGILKRDIVAGQKLMVLKDKATFHKAVIMAYTQLLEEIK